MSRGRIDLWPAERGFIYSFGAAPLMCLICRRIIQADGVIYYPAGKRMRRGDEYSSKSRSTRAFFITRAVVAIVAARRAENRLRRQIIYIFDAGKLARATVNERLRSFQSRVPIQFARSMAIFLLHLATPFPPAMRLVSHDRMIR